jgi:hypothetical protein
MSSHNSTVYLGNGVFIPKCNVMSNLYKARETPYTKEDLNKRRGTYEFYVEWMEETCYDFELLIILTLYDEKDKRMIEPHLDKLKIFCDEQLDKLERIENIKRGAYSYFIELLKLNNLDLPKTVEIEPYIYRSFMGLIKRTHKRLIEENKK